MEKDEKVLTMVVRIFIGLIVAIFMSGFFFAIPNWTDDLYDTLHPVKVWDILGAIMFVGGAAYIGGFLNSFIEGIDDKRYDAGKKEIGIMKFNWIAFAMVGVGFLLTLI